MVSCSACFSIAMAHAFLTGGWFRNGTQSGAKKWEGLLRVIVEDFGAIESQANFKCFVFWMGDWVIDDRFCTDTCY